MEIEEIKRRLRKPTCRPDEAAQMLGVSKWKVYEMIRAGVLPTVPGISRPKRIPSWALKKILFGDGERG